MPRTPVEESFQLSAASADSIPMHGEFERFSECLHCAKLVYNNGRANCKAKLPCDYCHERKLECKAIPSDYKTDYMKLLIDINACNEARRAYGSDSKEFHSRDFRAGWLQGLFNMKVDKALKAEMDAKLTPPLTAPPPNSPSSPKNGSEGEGAHKLKSAMTVDEEILAENDSKVTPPPAASPPEMDPSKLPGPVREALKRLKSNVQIDKPLRIEIEKKQSAPSTTPSPTTPMAKMLTLESEEIERMMFNMKIDKEPQPASKAKLTRPLVVPTTVAVTPTESMPEMSVQEGKESKEGKHIQHTNGNTKIDKGGQGEMEPKPEPQSLPRPAIRSTTEPPSPATMTTQPESDDIQQLILAELRKIRHVSNDILELMRKELR